MLKSIRVILAIVFFLAVTALFLDFTGTASSLWGWTAKVQFLPALLSLNLIVVAGLLLLTLIFGRIYCSVICPLGVMQDGFTWLRGRFKIKKKRINRFNYVANRPRLRLAILILFAIALAIPVTHFVATLIAPYSAYGRIVTTWLQPLYDSANNLLADSAAENGSFTFYHVDKPVLPLAFEIVGWATLIIVGATAFVAGRAYCNNICPVGSVLGFVAKFALLKPYIDTSKCNGCTKCARNCKASCIDAKNHRIDYSRCVDCMDCIGNCSQHAIKYGIRKQASSVSKNCDITDTGRRLAITTAIAMAGASVVKAASDKLVDGGLTPITPKTSPKRASKITPAGSHSHSHFGAHCTSCQLCVSACPNGVLRPSTSLESFMQPEMSYENGYCRPECTRCSQVCPTGAITPIDAATKSSISIGTAHVNTDLCLSTSEGVNCGNCERHCPAEAIVMTEIAGRITPVVNESLCIGCGACENLCPVRPISAITVEGRAQHAPRL